MASIRQETEIAVAPDRAWNALREIGAAHRLFSPVLTDAQVDGDIRTVRFANGMTVREHMLDVDDVRRRVAYTAMNVPNMTYHHASMEIAPAAPGRCRFIWITDLLPEEMSEAIKPLIDQGAAALKANLETAAG